LVLRRKSAGLKILKLGKITLELKNRDFSVSSSSEISSRVLSAEGKDKSTSAFENQSKIFKKGSRTYFVSSLFFPPDLRKKVTILYAFVRTADDFVDSTVADSAGFADFEDRYREGFMRGHSEDSIIGPFLLLAKNHNFDPSWVESFLAAMRSDLHHSPCTTLAETEQYMYGSAEVVGLMMSRLMDLPEISFPFAQKLGKSMQYINFLRDIEEDRLLNRIYLPKKEYTALGLPSLTLESARQCPEVFKHFVALQVARFEKWSDEAKEGYQFIPVRARIAIATATDMYRWTAYQILRDPFVVFAKKVKPSRQRIIGQGTKNLGKALVSRL
jgi:15-cis-phytoene synthase